MQRVKLLDKTFEKFIPNEKIIGAIERIANQINKDLADEDVLFICILNGAFIFSTEVFKRIDNLKSEITFLKYASYEGTNSTGKPKQLIGLNETLEGRAVVILEDIVDTGTTIVNAIDQLKQLNPKSIKIAAMLFKPGKYQYKETIDYVGLEIENDFIVGFGLDYDHKGRNLADIYKIVED